MLQSVRAPRVDGEGEPLVHYAQQGELRRQGANLDPVRRAPALSFHMDSVARENRMVAGSDVTMDLDGIKRISRWL